MLGLTGNSSMAESLATERKIKYNYYDKKPKAPLKEDKKNIYNKSKKIISASDLFDSDEEIAQIYANDENISRKSAENLGDALAVDARDTERLTRTTTL
jgi:hypothetical protein